LKPDLERLNRYKADRKRLLRTSPTSCVPCDHGELRPRRNRQLQRRPHAGSSPRARRMTSSRLDARNRELVLERLGQQAAGRFGNCPVDCGRRSSARPPSTEKQHLVLLDRRSRPRRPSRRCVRAPAARGWGRWPRGRAPFPLKDVSFTASRYESVAAMMRLPAAELDEDPRQHPAATRLAKRLAQRARSSPAATRASTAERRPPRRAPAGEGKSSGL